MKYVYWIAAFAGVEILVILPLLTAACYWSQNRARKARSKQWAVVYPYSRGR